MTIVENASFLGGGDICGMPLNEITGIPWKERRRVTRAQKTPR